jgi:hypothetical protein
MFDRINKITVLEEKINRNAIEMKNLKQDNERLSQTSKEQDERLKDVFKDPTLFLIVYCISRVENGRFHTSLQN